VLGRSRVARVTIAVVVAVGGGALVLRAFGGVDWRRTIHAIAAIGPLAPLVFVPFFLAMVVDCLGLRILLETLGRSVSIARLLPIRIGTEALHVTAPAGFLVADSVTATILDVRCGVPLAEGAMLAVARKWLVMRGHSFYIVLGTAAGATALADVSQRHFGGPWLPWAVGLSALAPMVLSIGIGTGFRGRPAFARILSPLGRAHPSRSVSTRGPTWAWSKLRDRAHRWGAGAATLDARLARIGSARRATWAAAAAFFVCWLLESVDTAIVLRLVGGPLDWSLAFAAEVAISMLRSVGNMAPVGLGVQDAGYATLFRSMGLSPEGSVAFVLVKRGKELVWIAIGYTLLALLRRSGSAASRPQDPAHVHGPTPPNVPALPGLGC
jgi:hypothetical protein